MSMRYNEPAASGTTLDIADATIGGLRYQKYVAVNPADGAAIVPAQAVCPGAATVAAVTGTGAAINLFASNAAARVRAVYNNSGQTLYLKFGAAASAALFSVKLNSGDYFEFPSPLYTGQVTGLWASGDAMTTEVI